MVLLPPSTRVEREALGGNAPPETILLCPHAGHCHAGGSGRKGPFSSSLVPRVSLGRPAELSRWSSTWLRQCLCCDNSPGACRQSSEVSCKDLPKKLHSFWCCLRKVWGVISCFFCLFVFTEGEIFGMSSLVSAGFAGRLLGCFRGFVC